MQWNDEHAKAVRRLRGLWYLILVVVVAGASAILLLLQVIDGFETEFASTMVLPPPLFWTFALLLMVAGVVAGKVVMRQKFQPRALGRAVLAEEQTASMGPVRKAELRLRNGMFNVLSVLDLPGTLLFAYGLVSNESLPLVLGIAYSLVIAKLMEPDLDHLLRETTALVDNVDGRCGAELSN